MKKIVKFCVYLTLDIISSKKNSRYNLFLDNLIVIIIRIDIQILVLLIEKTKLY